MSELESCRHDVGPGETEYCVLTERERELLIALMTGASHADAVGALRIRENTVETHLGNIYEKLGAHAEKQAIPAGIARGCIPCYCEWLRRGG